MLPKQLIFGASAVAAVASASQMTLLRGSGEYPRLSGFSYYDNREKHVKCSFYNDQDLTERYLALNFYVKDDSMRTESIYCPKTTNRTAFNIQNLTLSSNDEMNNLLSAVEKISFTRNRPMIFVYQLYDAEKNQNENRIESIKAIKSVCDAAVQSIKEQYDSDELCDKSAKIADTAVTSARDEGWVPYEKPKDRLAITHMRPRIPGTAAH
ncbi:hypothetical protein FOZ60_016791 [Perkinsus olseni]|uniref:Uncharacterized protein n=1 Tax=Perkinsus olseni TaxID=32597 RepID=A0A7J6P401_PEROL|nr:hypothetical protein FOZ60_016791 [Perkinsus olseni]